MGDTAMIPAESKFILEMIVGGLGAFAMFFFGYTINGIKKSIDTMLGDFKELERRVSRLEAGREESLAFRHTIEVMFEKVTEQYKEIIRRMEKIEAWVERKERDILDFYKTHGRNG